MAKSAMEVVNNGTCTEVQAQIPKRGEQFLLDFMAEEQLKKSKTIGKKAATAQVMREEYPCEIASEIFSQSIGNVRTEMHCFEARRGALHQRELKSDGYRNSHFF